MTDDKEDIKRIAEMLESDAETSEVLGYHEDRNYVDVKNVQVGLRTVLFETGYHVSKIKADIPGFEENEFRVWFSPVFGY